MSPASDVYSLAVVAARALTGLTGDYEAVRGALPAGGAHRARPGHRRRDPARRYSSAAVFGQALTEALGVASDRRCSTSCDREPVQGLARVRGSRRRRLLRARATRRTADRPARRARHPWAVRRRGRAERQRQVERGAGRAAAGAARRGAVPDVGGWFAIEMTRRRTRSRSSRRRSARVAVEPPASLLDSSPSTRAACGAPSSASCPTDAIAAAAGDRPVRGAVHQVDDDTASRFLDELVGAGHRRRAAGSGSSSRCAPTSTTGRCSTAASANCSATAPRWSRRCRSRSSSGDHRPGEQVGVNVEPARGRRDGGARSSTARAPCRCCSTR